MQWFGKSAAVLAAPTLNRARRWQQTELGKLKIDHELQGQTQLKLQSNPMRPRRMPCDRDSQA